MAPPPTTFADNKTAPDEIAESMRPVRLHKRARLVSGLMFVVALFVPLFGTAFNWDPVQSSENRVLAKVPEVPHTFRQLTELSGSFLAYFRDHFGFRNALIRGLSLAKYHSGLAFDTSSKTFIGRDGWLFYPSDYSNLLADRNLDPFTPQELDAWQEMLEHRNKFCQEHGIKFIAVIPPDKQEVYREYMPDEYSVLGKQSRLDQIVQRLKDTHSPVQLIDLRPALLRARQYHRIYFKTDTHWNDYGGYAAYPVLLKAMDEALHLNMAPQPLSDFIPRSTIHSGDLARYMNLYYEYTENWPQLMRRIPFARIVRPESPFIPVVTSGDPRGPSLYMIHDSYTLYLGQYLGPHFSRACWQWSPFLNGPMVLQFKPDVVLDEFLERTMYAPVPKDTPDVLATEIRHDR